MSVAARLRDLRMKKGRSLQEVAEAIGVSKTHVWELEKGRAENPSLEMLTKLSDYFGVTIRSLVGEDLENSSDEKLVRMFRQVGDLTEADRDILDDMIQSLRRRRSDNGSQN
ncbi:helix-turn-helix domain-containing protein [Radicibacter daui]|uniref:helix-turn-helix domain-containing protein n=1 Tax=Radicibacter daui TaxID=3064829 RepID=UPI004046A37E